VLGSSTLHLFWDLPALLAGRSVVLVEQGTYAIGRGGAQRAAAARARVAEFAHHNPRALHRALLALAPGRRALVVIDSVAPGDDDRSPMPEYAELAKRFGALLVIDDTQALGILGSEPDARLPYGYGGGGSLRHHGLRGSHLVVIASLAKALGVPLAVLAGSSAEVARFSAGSETRTHSSPPSTAALRAAERAVGQQDAGGRAPRAPAPPRAAAARRPVRARACSDRR
jgi:8-amino-7-oxononanoate synthase